MDCRTKCDGVFPQGEQCNIVPDNVDDIVADIAQEEKEEGLALLALLWYAKLKTQFEISGLCYLCSLYRPADDTPETCIYSNWSPWSACSSATCEKGKRMRQRMLKAQLDLSVPCPHTQDFEPCMGPGCSDEGEHLEDKCCCAGEGKGGGGSLAQRHVLSFLNYCFCIQYDSQRWGNSSKCLFLS